jgi:erythromycin esterase-like protein
MDNQDMIQQMRQHTFPLRTKDDLQKIVDAVGERKYVLLGEASHGTSEFYTLRTELSKRLIEQKGFSFIAVEGDWPSCYHMNRYVKQYAGAYQTSMELINQFKRWPSWMWANHEIVDLMEWLKHYNSQQTENKQIGFYGLDVYSLWESMETIIGYLEKTNAPQSQLELAKKAFACFEPYGEDEQLYGFSAWSGEADCADEVAHLLQEMQAKRQANIQEEEADLSAELNALVAVNAEKYYRSMIQGGPDSWNIRDRHMTEVLQKLTDFHGKDAKAIVWEHNTHIGDARATDMSADGMVNVGQLVREHYGKKQVFAVGFGTHRGTVIAAKAWGAQAESMNVPVAIPNSWEDLFHQVNPYDQMAIFNDQPSIFTENHGHRAIGVVYHPKNERGNYVPTRLSLRYDAFVYLEHSHALRPFEIETYEPIATFHV